MKTDGERLQTLTLAVKFPEVSLAKPRLHLFFHLYILATQMVCVVIDLANLL